MFRSLLKPSASDTKVPERIVESRETVTRRPAMHVSETETGYDIIMNVPGVPADALEMVIDKGTLTLRGQAVFKTPDHGDIIYREYTPGTFEGVVTLPRGVDVEGITAQSRNGQVHVVLPKVKAAQPRKITVTAAQ